MTKALPSDTREQPPTQQQPPPAAGTRRRDLVRLSLAAGLGATTAVAGVKGVELYRERYPLPFYGGYAAPIHGDRRTEPHQRQVLESDKE